MHWQPWALAFATPFAVSSIHAQTLATDLAPVFVTATRTPAEAQTLPASVTVITRDDIDRLQSTSVPELLRGVAGLDIASNGGAGKATSVFLRGTDSDQVLVLVDGVRIGSATAGGAAWQDLPVDLIERIEIVRGPRSGLYGADAVGGVVQIFTRGGARAGVLPRASLSVGSQNTRGASAGIGGGVGTGWFDVGVSHRSTDGFNTCLGRTTPTYAGCYVEEPDRDGYRNTSGQVRGGWRFDGGATLDAKALRTEGRTYYDGSVYAGNATDFVQSVYGLNFKAPLNSTASLRAALGRSTDEQANLWEGTPGSHFDTTRSSASVQTDLRFGGTLLSLGVDHTEDKVESDTVYARKSRTDTGVFAEAQLALGAHALQFALRGDDDEQFGSHTTGSLGWSTALGERLRVYANAGTGFKAPTFNELYYPGFGNPNLDPETSTSVEAGVRGEYANSHWSLAAFENRIDDLIGYDASYVPANIDRARIRGLEADWRAQWGATSLAFALTALDPKNRSAGAYDGKLLPRRAKQTARIDLDQRMGAWQFGASLNAQSHRYDDQLNTVRVGGFATLDLRAEHAFARDWTLALRVANATDKHYETAYLFPQDGRTVLLTLRYSPSGR